MCFWLSWGFLHSVRMAIFAFHLRLIFNDSGGPLRTSYLCAMSFGRKERLVPLAWCGPNQERAIKTSKWQVHAAAAPSLQHDLTWSGVSSFPLSPHANPLPPLLFLFSTLQASFSCLSLPLRPAPVSPVPGEHSPTASRRTFWLFSIFAGGGRREIGTRPVGPPPATAKNETVHQNTPKYTKKAKRNTPKKDQASLETPPLSFHHAQYAQPCTPLQAFCHWRSVEKRVEEALKAYHDGLFDSATDSIAAPASLQRT